MVSRLLPYMLFLSLFCSSYAATAQQLYSYSIRFKAGVEALPSLANLDSLKMIAAAALPVDTQTIIIRRYIDYWQQDENYYVLTRKRTFLLQQIFQRAGIVPQRLVIETMPLENPDSAVAERNRIDVLLTPHYTPSVLTDTIKTEEVTEPNFYSEIRELLWQLTADEQQRFLINPWRDTMLQTVGGASVFIAAGSFAIGKEITEIEFLIQEAYSKPALLPYQLATLEEDSLTSLREYGGVVQLLAKAAGRELDLKADKEILLFLPTDDLQTNLRLHHSKTSPRNALRWRSLEMGFWEPETALCLHLAEAAADGTYYCQRQQMERPAVPVFPVKPDMPALEVFPPERLVVLDSAIQLYEEIMNGIKAEYEAKTGRRWASKKKKEKGEQEYQRNLENALRQKKKAETEKKKELAVVEHINAARMAVYDSIFYLYNYRRDSLQQAYLSAIRDWHIARDSLQWLCGYEQHQWGFLQSRYGAERIAYFQQYLRASSDPDLRSPQGKLLFPMGKAHFIVPTRRLGWLSLQRKHPYIAPTLHYTVFTYRELPTYKLASMSFLRNSRSAVAGKASDAENISFNPLPAEDKIWVLALYIEGGKYMMALQPAVANRLPMKPEFKEFTSLQELEEALKRVGE